MSEARADLDPEARAKLPPPIPAPAVQQAAGQSATVYPFPTAPAATAPGAPAASATPPLETTSGVVPGYLQPLVRKIKGGESGNRDVLYGGAPTPPGNVIPGAIGPTGQPTHAFSEWQFEPKTWNDAAGAFRQLGWVLNKDDPSDRDRAGLWVARRDYKAKTGRDLDADAQAGKIDESALQATWTSIRPQYAQARQERYEAGSSELNQISAASKALYDKIDKMGGRDPALFKTLSEARQKMAEYEERALKLTEEGPKNDPRDLMQRMGGVATVIGVLGGLLTHQPMMASLNAGGAAMEAYNKQDEVAYKANVEQWRYHIDALQKMGRVQHDLIRDTLADEKLEQGEKMGRLQAMLSALGNERMAEVARLGDVRALENHRDQMAQSDRQFTRLMQHDKETERHNQETERRLAEGTNVGEALTQEEKLYYAKRYKITGQLPPLYRDAKTRVEIMKLAANLGGGDVSADISRAAGVRSDSASLTNVTRIADSAEAYENTALANMEIVKEKMPKGVGTNFGPWLDKWVQSGRVGTGDPNVPPYATALVTVANEYAKVMAGSTGAQASTVDARKEAAELLNMAQTTDQVMNVMEVMKQDMENKKASYRNQREAIQGRIQTGADVGAEVPKIGQSAPASAARAAPYSINQIIDRGGKKYRVTGGDMNDPDVELVQ